MEKENLEPGYLVESTQGRDEGNVYLILTRPSEQYMRLIDGNHKLLINPKLKKLRHVKPLNIKLEKLQEKISNNVKIFDSEVYSAIKKACEE